MSRGCLVTMVTDILRLTSTWSVKLSDRTVWREVLVCNDMLQSPLGPRPTCMQARWRPCMRYASVALGRFYVLWVETIRAPRRRVSL